MTVSRERLAKPPCETLSETCESVSEGSGIKEHFRRGRANFAMTEVEEPSAKRARTERDERVVLNVGGRRFETRFSTLPCDSMPARMLRNPEMARPDEDGSFFFDRSPDAFAAVLDAWRRGRQPSSAKPMALALSRREWCDELAFWGAAAGPEELEDSSDERRAFCRVVSEEVRYLFAGVERVRIAVPQAGRRGWTMAAPRPPVGLTEREEQLYRDDSLWRRGLGAATARKKTLDAIDERLVPMSPGRDEDADEWRAAWDEVGVTLSLEYPYVREYTLAGLRETYPAVAWIARGERPFDTCRGVELVMTLLSQEAKTPLKDNRA